MFLSGKIENNNLIYENEFINEEISIDISKLQKDEVDLLATMIDTLEDFKEDSSYDEYCELKEIDDSFMKEGFCQEYIAVNGAAALTENKELIYDLYNKALENVFRGSEVYNVYLEKNK